MSVIELNRGETTYRNDCLDAWIRGIRQYKVLTPREEEEVIIKYKGGDRKMLDILIEGNQRFLLAAARSYSRNADDILELISEGNLALIDAIERFDLTYGIRFLSYASYYIRRSMLLWLKNKGCVKVRIIPVVGEYIKKVKKEWLKERGYDIPDWVLSELVCSEFEDKLKKRPVYLSGCKTVYNEETVLEEAGGSTVIERACPSYNDAVDKMSFDDAKTMSLEFIEEICRDELECAVIVYSYGLFGKKELADYSIGLKYGMDADEVSIMRKRILARMRRMAMRGYAKGERRNFIDFIENEL